MSELSEQIVAAADDAYCRWLEEDVLTDSGVPQRVRVTAAVLAFLAQRPECWGLHLRQGDDTGRVRVSKEEYDRRQVGEFYHEPE